MFIVRFIVRVRVRVTYIFLEREYVHDWIHPDESTNRTRYSPGLGNICDNSGGAHICAHNIYEEKKNAILRSSFKEPFRTVEFESKFAGLILFPKVS